MRAVLLMCLIFMLFQGSVHATTNWYQPAGVITFEYSNSSNTVADFSALEKDRYFPTLNACNSYIAAMNNLLPDGTSAPNSGNNIRQHADGHCHAVLPYQQSSGWYALGNQHVRQSGKVGRRVDLDMGPFATEDDCLGAIVDQKTVLIQNGPITGLNIGYDVKAVCKQTY